MSSLNYRVYRFEVIPIGGMAERERYIIKYNAIALAYLALKNE
jgi:hypothetical protein